MEIQAKVVALFFEAIQDKVGENPYFFPPIDSKQSKIHLRMSKLLKVSWNLLTIGMTPKVKRAIDQINFSKGNN